MCLENIIHKYSKLLLSDQVLPFPVSIVVQILYFNGVRPFWIFWFLPCARRGATLFGMAGLFILCNKSLEQFRCRPVRDGVAGHIAGVDKEFHRLC